MLTFWFSLFSRGALWQNHHKTHLWAALIGALAQFFFSAVGWNRLMGKPASFGRGKAASVGALLCVLAVATPGWALTGWKNRAPSPSPVGRDAHAMAYDSARGVTVLFGGNGNPQVLNDTWEWNGTTWTQKTLNGATGSPPARQTHSMVYDSARGVSVLFGGSDGNNNNFNDTWEWNGTTWTQKTLNGAAGNPPARQGGAMAYDSARGVTVLFGGSDANLNNFNDTWEWNGTAWTQRTSNGASSAPPARATHAMSYDSTRGVSVLFGGYGAGFLNDTWEWNGTTWTQKTLNGATGSPSSRYSHAMVFDKARGVSVVFGGYVLDNSNDTWEWSGTSWTKKTFSVATDTPSARPYVAMSYDSARSATVLFGGYSSSSFFSDTWEYGEFAPVITSFTPTSGAVGGSVTLTGTSFTGATGVSFNNTAATYTVVSSTQITTTVPTGATTGPIKVTTPNGTATSASNYTVSLTESPSLVVTTASDTSTNTDNLTSLREAINYVNTNPGADTISFAIPGSSVQTISLASALPVITHTGTIIDGYTQSGASVNTLTTGSNAVIKIQLQRTGTRSFDAITIGAANCTVKGLSITNCRYAVYINGVSTSAASALVTGNLLGLKADGITRLANFTGVYINSAASNTIGGTAASERNIICGNSDANIRISGATSAGNKVIGNTIGTLADCSISTVSDGAFGIIINNSGNNTVGGTAVGERNIISGNYYGVYIVDGTPSSTLVGNKVLGNYIGVKSDGTSALGNTYGVIVNGAVNNTIGGIAVGEGNVIANSTRSGVAIVVTPSTGNSVRGNSIYNSGSSATDLGIELSATGGTGVDANDTNDADTGPNNLQNFPVLSSASSSGGNTTINGTLNSIANSTFALDFYSSPTIHSSGYGEGKTYLGSTSVTTSGNNASFSAILTGVTVAVGTAITATATDASGNTSEFSLAISSTPPPPSVSVGLSSTSPKTNDTLTATATPSNFSGTPTYSYQWKVGATVKQTGTSNSYDLSQVGYGDRGQVVTCTVTATSGAQNATGSATATVINSAPVITTTSLPNGTINVAYGPLSLAATDADGDSPLTWTVSGGTLPAGLSLSSAGMLSGTPTQTGSFSFTVTANDGQGGTNSKTLSLTVNSAPDIRISELRFGGPQGALDEFVELANSTGTPLDLSGWTLTAGSVFVAIPSGKTIPAYGRLLLANSGSGTGANDGYSLGTYATGDVTYTGDIATNSTVQLRDAGGTLMDSVSNLSGISSPSSSSAQYSYVRRLENGVPQDTNTDANDFNLVDISNTTSTVDGTGVGPMTGARLGAPGPQNRFSPIQNNLGVALSSINIPGNGLAGTAVTPEARYVSKNSTIDPKGRLSLRRSITNNTGATVTQMRFRIVAITAGNSTTSGVADVRAISSGGVRYYASDGTTIQQAAWPLVLEKPSLPNEAPLTATSGSTGKGGGLNSSWTVALPGGSLAPGASVGVEFLFGIVTDGNYRVVVDTELLP
ncbi:hypothetical protein IAD21_00485 [Abditibacteriota bacterium]|nr:hypothetical protein IAD21_00485 [Abditibacteriota bacterium]